MARTRVTSGMIQDRTVQEIDLVAGLVVPTGGTTGQVLAKTADTDYATAWTTAGSVGPASSVHEEFLPANGATTVTLSQPATGILMCARGGVVQSQTDGNYSLSSATLTFTDAFDGTERVVVDYTATGYTPVPPISGSGIADGTITSTQIQDGTIATADLANQSVTNIKLASDTARANLLTNGGMEIWQRGNGPFSVSGQWTADRWQMVLGGGSTGNVSRTSGGNVETGAGLYAMVCNYAHVASGYMIVQQKIENISDLLGKQITFSTRVYATVASGLQIAIGTTGGAAPVDARATMSGMANQTLSVTATIPPDALTLQISFIFGVLSGQFFMDRAMLVVGSVPADYAPLHPADDLARCLRYYETITGYSWIGYAGGAGAHNITSVIFRAQKPVNPTLTASGASYGGTANPSGLTSNQVDTQHWNPSVTTAAVGEIYVSANWVAEANP